MYAGSKPMTAADLCIVAFWAKQAGAQGDVQRLAMGPNHTGGQFQKHLDVVILRRPASDYYYL
eukprot:7015407-Pyramimonas_sp.AAC.1